MNFLRLTQRFASATPLRRTSLYDIHLANKAKMVEFAGYEMPVLYEDGVLKEHLHCRTHASLFDVSHMGQVTVTGPDRINFMERVCVGELKGKLSLYKHPLHSIGKKLGEIRQSFLTLFLNDNAGIIDDAIATIFDNDVKIVVNGANKYIDMENFKVVKERFNLNVNFVLDESRSLICIQGPEAVKVVERVLGIDATNIPFMSQFELKHKNYSEHLLVSRSGYTGEDGFELSFSDKDTNKFVNDFLRQPEVRFAGLGARDSLRVEAGLCLHGHDIGPNRTPFEGTLMWTVNKNKDGTRARFVGQDALEKQVNDQKEKKIRVEKRVGFSLDKAGVVREGALIKTPEGKQVGQVSSGTFSPVLKKGLGMMYVDQAFTKEGTALVAEVKERSYPIKVTKMPFVEAKYNRLWDKIV